MRTGTGNNIVEAVLDAVEESLLTVDSESVEFKQVDSGDVSAEYISESGSIYEVEVLADEGRVPGVAIRTDAEDPPVKVEVHTGGWF